MSNARALRQLPVLVTLLIAFMLMIMPLPPAAEPFRPDWLPLILVFWAMTVPRSYSVGIAWLWADVVLLFARGAPRGSRERLLRTAAAALAAVQNPTGTH